MGRRRLLILFHWLAALLLVTLVVAGPDRAVVTGFASVATLWGGLAAAFGLQAHPGPKLSGGARAAYPWLHRAIYAAIGLTALLGVLTLAGRAEGAFRVAAFATLTLGVAHGGFQIWRHTALRDGALRRILPRALHGLL